MSRARRSVLVIAFAAVGCGDRAPPALWPEPPPPTLAEPIGVEHGGRAPDPSAAQHGAPVTGASAPASTSDAPSGSDGSSTEEPDAPVATEPGPPTPPEREPSSSPSPTPRRTDETGGAAVRP